MNLRGLNYLISRILCAYKSVVSQISLIINFNGRITRQSAMVMS